ncbi:MAG: gamma-glutamyltransferase [Bradymonadia bacterium]
MTSAAGAVSGGNPLTVEAGLQALRLGGNAVDAAVAAKLMATVCEPLLTGLAGGGLILCRIDGEVRILDCFSDVPGRGHALDTPADMAAIDLDFGPDTQRFFYGPGSVAVPALAQGLWTLHQSYGRVPLAALVKPAAEAARAGVTVTPGLELSISLLWPIIQADPKLEAIFSGPDGGHARAGDRIFQRALADTLERLAIEGPDFLTVGDGAEAMLRRLDGEGRMTAQDLAGYTPIWRRPLVGRYKGADVYVPGPPSQAGALVLRTLSHLQAAGPVQAPLTGEHVAQLAAAMVQTEIARGGEWVQRMFESGFIEGWLAESDPMSTHGSGHTTHVSVTDGDGNAVAITSSLGETAGMLVPETGLILNNFLGETDVNPVGPSGPLRPPGARLLTMCCPTLLAHDGGIHVMGSGGSSRIRSALLHGVVYAVDHKWPEDQIVAGPRCHYEGGVLRVEAAQRPTGFLEPLQGQFERVIVFDEPGLFFGGLHMAGWRPGDHGPVLSGAGDARRSGTTGQVG